MSSYLGYGFVFDVSDLEDSVAERLNHLNSSEVEIVRFAGNYGLFLKESVTRLVPGEAKNVSDMHFNENSKWNKTLREVVKSNSLVTPTFRPAWYITSSVV